MDNFKLQTSIFFPYFKLHEDIIYSEVKKPSGIAYILLVLISESTSSYASIGNLLVNFGIPKSLHYLFADVLNDLINQNILKSDYRFVDLDDARLGMISFTEYGRKIFAEEAIPTGINKSDRISVFYDIANNQLLFDIDKSLEPRPLDNSYINEEFMSKFTCKKNVEDFLIAHRGEKWPRVTSSNAREYALVKKEEILTEVKEIDTLENWLAKQECDMNINGDQIDIVFENKTIQKFFEENYTNEMINNAFTFKNKFHFSSSFGQDLSILNYDNINKFYLPYELKNILDQKYKLFISKGNYDSTRSFKIIEKSGLNNLNSDIEFMIMDEKDSIYSFVPGVFTFKNEKFGMIKIPLVLKLKNNIQDLQNTVLPYLDSLKNFSIDNFKQLISVTNLTKDIDSCKQIVTNYFKGEPSENINKLIAVKEYAFLNNEIAQLYRETLNDNYINLISNTDKDNLETNLKISKSVPKILNLDTNKVLELYSEKLTNISNLETYELLVENGFKANLVCLYFNPIKEIISGKESLETNILNFINYSNSMQELMNLCGISKDKNLLIEQDQLNKEEFLRLFRNAYSNKKLAEMFRKCDEDLFKSYDTYYKMFEEVNDDINMQIQASKKPKNIQDNMIYNKIASGDYRSALVYLAVKLEYILTTYYKASGEGLFELISTSKGLDKNVVKELHRFRDVRNNNLHYGNKSDFDADDLKSWTKKIFDLEVKDE